MPNLLTIDAPTPSLDQSPRKEPLATGTSASCPNCGSEGVGHYCPECGQEQVTSIVPVADLIHEVADELFKYDSKLFVTLRALILRPGFLTTEYLSGRRASYIPPFRLYFWISALFFFTFSYTAQHQLEQTFDASRSSTIILRSGKTRSTSQTPASPQEKRRVALGNRIIERSQAGEQWLTSHMATVLIVLLPACALVLWSLYRRTQRLYTEFFIAALHIQSVLMLLGIPATFTNNFMFWNDAVGIPLSAIYTYLALRHIFHQSPLKTALKAVLYIVGIMFFSSLIGLLIIAVAIFLP